MRALAWMAGVGGTARWVDVCTIRPVTTRPVTAHEHMPKRRGVVQRAHHPLRGIARKIVDAFFSAAARPRATGVNLVQARDFSAALRGRKTIDTCPVRIFPFLVVIANTAMIRVAIGKLAFGIALAGPQPFRFRTQPPSVLMAPLVAFIGTHTRKGLRTAHIGRFIPVHAKAGKGGHIHRAFASQ